MRLAIATGQKLNYKGKFYRMGGTGSKKVIVISAVNLVEGGTLSVLRDCLSFASRSLTAQYRIIALVHKKDLIQDINGVEIIECSAPKNSWLKRVWFEYVSCRGISRALKPYLWLSLHDMTPTVDAEIRAVYCHNPTPFMKSGWKDLFTQTKVFLFSLFYKYLYQINIHKNDFVVVQQNWIRGKFCELFNIEEDRIIVAYPQVVIPQRTSDTNKVAKSDLPTFFFPTFPRGFKNIEIIGEAVAILEQKEIDGFKVIITINGSENKVASLLVNRYGSLKAMSFIGLIPRTRVYEHYQSSDCLLFPSKLETWGLPITEFKAFGKPIFAADLPYARETMGYYEKACFFNPEDPRELAALMEAMVKGLPLSYSVTDAVTPPPPFVESWQSLFDILLAPSKGKKAVV